MVVLSILGQHRGIHSIWRIACGAGFGIVGGSENPCMLRILLHGCLQYRLRGHHMTEMAAQLTTPSGKDVNPQW